jgi:hypothetical protein
MGCGYQSQPSTQPRTPSHKLQALDNEDRSINSWKIHCCQAKSGSRRVDGSCWFGTPWREGRLRDFDVSGQAVFNAIVCATWISVVVA